MNVKTVRLYKQHQPTNESGWLLSTGHIFVSNKNGGSAIKDFSHTHRHAKPAPRPYVLAATEIIRSARFRKSFLFCNSRGSHGGGAAPPVRSDSSSELTITAFDAADILRRKTAWIEPQFLLKLHADEKKPLPPTTSSLSVLFCGIDCFCTE